MSEVYRIEFTARARKDIAALDEAIKPRIESAITALSAEPRPPGCAKMKGLLACWRIRVGEYRVVYEIQDKVLLVTVVGAGPRGDIYKRFR